MAHISVKKLFIAFFCHIGVANQTIFPIFVAENNM